MLGGQGRGFRGIMANVSRAALRGVDLASAEKIIDYALKVARQKKLRPMTLAVLDFGGDLIAFKREDGTGIRRFDVVMGKAFGSLVMNRPSRAIGPSARTLRSSSNRSPSRRKAG